jgi:hypothetical protein
MKIDTLLKKLYKEFDLSEVVEEISNPTFNPGNILLIPNYKEHQRPWMTLAFNEWLKGDRTIVLICPMKPTCKYFKKLVTDVAEIRPIKETLEYNDYRIMKPMIIAIYKKKVRTSSFLVSFD